MANNDKMKQKEEEMWGELFPIENLAWFNDEKKFIKMFEEIY